MQSPEGCRCGILAPSRPCQGCPAVSDGHPEVGGPRLHGIQHHRRMVLAAPLEFPGSTRALAPQVVTASLHSGFLQVTPSQGPCTHTLYPQWLCWTLGTWPWPAGTHGHCPRWTVRCLRSSPVTSGEAEARNSQGAGEGPQAQTQCPDRCDPVFPIHAHGCSPLAAVTQQGPCSDGLPGLPR